MIRTRPNNPAAKTRSVSHHLLAVVRREHGRKAVFSLKDPRFAALRDFFLHGQDTTDDGFAPLEVMGEGWKEVSAPSGSQSYQLGSDGPRQTVTVTSNESIKLMTEAPLHPTLNRYSIEELTVGRDGSFQQKYHYQDR